MRLSRHGIGVFVIVFGFIASLLAVGVVYNNSGIKIAFTSEGAAINSIIIYSGAIIGYDNARDRIITAANAYKKSVLCEELPYMAKGCHTTTRIECDGGGCAEQRYYGFPGTLAAFKELNDSIVSFGKNLDLLSGTVNFNTYSVLVDIVTGAEGFRDLRITNPNNSVPIFIWVIIIIGIIVVASSPFIFNGPLAMKIFESVVLTTLFVFIFMVIYSYVNPYGGFVKLTPSDYPI